MTEFSLTVAGSVELHGEVDGPIDAPALLLINGAFCTVRSWDLAMPVLEGSFRVVRHDVRGTGASSSGPPEGYTFEQYADDIVAVCDHLQLERPHLWGMAWGARVALVTAATFGARFDSVLLSDLAIDPADEDAQRQGVATAKAARADAGIAEVPKPPGWNDHQSVDEARLALAATTHHTDLMPFVQRVSNRVLIATGDHDPNLVSSRRALGGFANVRLEVLEHTAHGAVLQHPVKMAELATSFFSAASH